MFHRDLKTVSRTQRISPEADVSGKPKVQKIQYQEPGTSNFVDITNTLYVLKGTTVDFKAIPNPNNATFPNGQPTWSGTSGATGTGQTKSVTFNTVSSSTSDYKTVIAYVDSPVIVNVVVYELQGLLTPQDNFTNRSQERYGLLEKVDLNFSTNPALTTQQIGGLEWKLLSGIGTITNSTMPQGAIYTAPATSSNEIIKLEILTGPSKGESHSLTRTVVQPNGAVARQTPGTGIGHTNGNCSVGFSLEPYLLPTDVSFNQLGFMEGDVSAITTPPQTGYYWIYEGASHGISGPTSISSCNKLLGCKADFTDQVSTDDPRTPCSTGDFTWNIPWQYVIGANISTASTFYTAIHYQVNTPPDKVSIQKGGVGPFTKAISDPTTFIFP